MPLTPPPTLHEACTQLVQPFGAATWVVAVSGGVDSTVLLHTLAGVAKKQPIQLVAAYVDHQWRTPPAPELEPLWQQCQQWQVPLVICPITASTPKTETAARDARLQALQGVVQRFNAAGVILGHHADDQWETLLMRVFRGTGPSGLQGIQPVSQVNVTLAGASPEEASARLTLLHPLLPFNKDDLYTTAEMFQLRWAEDTTNADDRHARNALRKEVMPVIEKQFPQARQHVLHLAQLASQQATLAENALLQVWQQLWNGRSLDVMALNQLDEAYQAGLIRQLLRHHGLPASKATVLKVLDFLQGVGEQFATAQQLSIEGASTSQNAETEHVFLKCFQHRLYVVPASQTALPEETAAALQAEGITAGLPVRFRLAQLFPTWAGIGPAAADDADDTLNATVSGADDEEDSEDSELDDEETVIDPLAEEDDDAETDSDVDDEEDAEDSENALLESDDADDTDAELLGDVDSPQGAGKGETSDEEDDEEEALNATTRHTLHTTRTQIIELPEYGAELEIARLGPDEAIPNPLPSATSHTIYVNFNPLVNDVLTIRHRRTGDRIHPLGMMSGMRLKNYLINRGIPQHERNQLPLLASQTDVLWVVGVGFSELLRIHQRPTHRLTWRFVTPNSLPDQSFQSVVETPIAMASA